MNLSHLIKQCSNNSINIGIIFPNSIDYVVAYFGVLFAGKTIVPIQPQLTINEIISVLKYCEIDLIITNSCFKKKIEQLVSKKIYNFKVYYLDSSLYQSYEYISFIQKSEMPKKNKYYNDIAIMLNTSGTMSNPKRVMLSHYNIISNIESNIKSLNLTKDETTLITLPMYFGYCNTAQFLTHIYLGAKIVIIDSPFLPQACFKAIEEKKVTNTTLVPTTLLSLLFFEQYDLYNYESLNFICFGGGFVPVDKLKKIIEKFPNISFCQTYGLTECSPRVTLLESKYSLSKIGSVGKPIPNVKVKIQTIVDDKLGEILVAGPNIMKGYYKNKPATLRTIKKGWLHTGDLGYLDDDGFLYLTGRIKNIIISGGINIYPEEIEEVILNMEGIKDVVVYGIKHDFLGEVPCAKIVLLNDHITVAEIKKHCCENLTTYKIPKQYEFVKKIEKTYSGKLKRIINEECI